MALEYSDWPNDIDPHRCGTAPFVPDVWGPEQNSCGSYKAGFNEKGCNKFLPNYPDDQYIAKHGAKGLSDCYNGVAPDGDCKGAGPRQLPPIWPTTGFLPDRPIGPACAINNDAATLSLVERFASVTQSGLGFKESIFYILFAMVVVWLLTKFMKR